MTFFNNGRKLFHFTCRNALRSSFCLKHQWHCPAGKESGVFIYNVVAKKKVPLILKNPSYLSWYSCGPTVYDDTHIGHASSYMRLDIIQRILLKWFGVESVVALGVTDIDDKILKKSKDLVENYTITSKRYEVDFFRALSNLHIKRPHFILRVTEHIEVIVRFIEKVVKSNHAYLVPDGTVYFDTRSLGTYGKVTRTPVLGEELPARDSGRKHAADFALWKAAKSGEPSWPSPWGPGRPGWHIECSAMSSKIFGNELDVHTGGLDLAFPHHENEEAQCCAYHDTKQWVSYWIHTGHLLMNGMKMSKSMKNFVPVSTFLEQYSPDDLRMLCLIQHYRSSIDYTTDVMKKSVALVNKFQTFLGDARSYCKGTWDRGNVSGPAILELLDFTRRNIKECLADDFNTPRCINLLENLVKESTIMLHAEPADSLSMSQVRPVAQMAAVADFVQDCLESLGLMESQTSDSDENFFELIAETAVQFRQNIRIFAKSIQDRSVRAKLLELCDVMRSDLKMVNVCVKDTGDKSSWSRMK